MNGTIFFNDSEELAEFLKHWVGQTATFEVTRWNSLGWQLTFLGGF
jgi:hypothetical protein